MHSIADNKHYLSVCARKIENYKFHCVFPLLQTFQSSLKKNKNWKTDE